jgi:hypothetical protein
MSVPTVPNVVRFQEVMTTITEWLLSSNIDCEFDASFLARTRLSVDLYNSNGNGRFFTLQRMLVYRIQYDFLRGSESGGNPQITNYMQILSKKSKTNPKSKIRITGKIHDLWEIRTLNEELKPEIYKSWKLFHISSPLLYSDLAAIDTADEEQQLSQQLTHQQQQQQPDSFKVCFHNNK